MGFRRNCFHLNCILQMYLRAAECSSLCGTAGNAQMSGKQVLWRAVDFKNNPNEIQGRTPKSAKLSV